MSHKDGGKSDGTGTRKIVEGRSHTQDGFTLIGWLEEFQSPNSEYGLFRVEIVVQLPASVDVAKLMVTDPDNRDIRGFPFVHISGSDESQTQIMVAAPACCLPNGFNTVKYLIVPSEHGFKHGAVHVPMESFEIQTEPSPTDPAITYFLRVLPDGSANYIAYQPLSGGTPEFYVGLEHAIRRFRRQLFSLLLVWWVDLVKEI